MEFGEMKLNTSNWSNFGMLLRRAGLTASAGLSCFDSRCTDWAQAQPETVQPMNTRYQYMLRSWLKQLAHMKLQNYNDRHCFVSVLFHIMLASS